MPVLADKKPYLIDGHDLQAFARQMSDAQKWEKPATNTPWNYFACFRCKGYRKPYLLKYVRMAPTPMEKAEKLEQLRVLENGDRMVVGVVGPQVQGVDTPEDLRRLERIVRRNPR